YWVLIREILLSWVEVSHMLVRARFALRMFNSFAEMLSRVGRRRRRVRKVLPAAEVKGNWRRWTAAWKGIDSAITRFCGEAGFERDQLFAFFRPLPAVIEEARTTVADDVLSGREGGEWG